VQPRYLLRDLENIVRETFPKNIQLSFCVPDDIWTLLGDPTQVHQILLNLCVNARDAMPDGGSLSISAENRTLDRHELTAEAAAPQAGRYVYIRVSDSGAGISRNTIHKIFEPFFTTKALNKGTGLGLSTVMAIVKSHNGMIDVDSEPGKGATFEVYLPALGDPAEPPQGRTPEVSVPQGRASEVSVPRGNGEKILVVDDEPSILTLTAQTLETFGYRVLTARNGVEALAVHAEEKDGIAVVVTDTVMPVLGGPSLIETLLRTDSAIKIVRTSGFESKDAGALPGAGVSRFLPKPYTADVLLETIRTILEED
jgi:CheY-like chemotaxis protein